MGQPAVRFGLLLEGRPLTGRRERGKRAPWILGRGVFLILFSMNLFVGLMNVSGGIMRHDVSDICWGSTNLLIAFLLWLSDWMDARKAVRDDAGDRINRNALELAEWFAGMSFTDPDDQLAQSQLRGVLETVDDSADADRKQQAETLAQAFRIMTLLSDATCSRLVQTFGVFSLCMTEYPRYWRQIDAAYRETMLRVSQGENLNRKAVLVRVSRFKRLAVPIMFKDKSE